VRLAERLLAASFVIVSVLVLGVVVIAGGRLRARLAAEQRAELHRDARLVAAQWRPGADPDDLADTTASALGYRVMLIGSDGTVLGDSEFDGEALRRIENYGSRPEIAEARARGVGSASGVTSSPTDQEVFVAIRHPPLGFVRVSVGTDRFERIVRGAQRDVIVASLLALAGTLLLAWLFSRSVSRPVTELRDVAQAIASGDLSARPALSAPGEIGDLAAALHRMTEELARRLDALREEDALLTALVESLNEGVLALTERGDVARINQRGRILLRITAPAPFPGDVLPRNPTMRQAIEAALAGEAADPAELQIAGRTLAVTARPLAVGGAVVTLFDLTPMRRLETVRQDFAANVSHELKTPLTVVHGFAETLLLDPDLPRDQRQHFAEAIVANATRMQRIVDELLDLSRIESGGWRPDPVWVDTAGLIRDVFTTVESAAKRKSLRLAAEVDGVQRIYADPTAVRQVLCNLVENAVRHTATGAVSVRSDAQAGGVWLHVRDTGVGIAAEHLPRIFERFYRVDAARSRSEGGTGLGLAIVKHLVEAHGGRVRAESEPGRGTTVSVFFPDGPDARRPPELKR
jgi:two-component system, OmpR family, phosphate regulon sensor histidine kinase PhoR